MKVVISILRPLSIKYTLKGKGNWRYLCAIQIIEISHILNFWCSCLHLRQKVPKGKYTIMHHTSSVWICFNFPFKRGLVSNWRRIFDHCINI